MDLFELYRRQGDTALVNALYADGKEEDRLFRSRAAQVEFLTTMRVLEDYVRPGMRVLDLGAGTGAYTLPLAERGCAVDAVELSEKNAALLRDKVEPGQRVRVFCRSAAELSDVPSGVYDLVLLLGPLYHLHEARQRRACIREAVRVCKAEGTLLLAYLSNDMIPLTECRMRDFFSPETAHTYDHETFQVENFPFVFLTLDGMRRELWENGVELLREIAADGVSELLADTINAMSDASYQEYLKYHFYCCEKPEMLGRSSHVLLVGRAAQVPPRR